MHSKELRDAVHAYRPVLSQVVCHFLLVRTGRQVHRALLSRFNWSTHSVRNVCAWYPVRSHRQRNTDSPETKHILLIVCIQYRSRVYIRGIHVLFEGCIELYIHTKCICSVMAIQVCLNVYKYVHNCANVYTFMVLSVCINVYVYYHCTCIPYIFRVLSSLHT